MIFLIIIILSLIHNRGPQHHLTADEQDQPLLSTINTSPQSEKPKVLRLRRPKKAASLLHHHKRTTTPT